MNAQDAQVLQHCRRSTADLLYKQAQKQHIPEVLGCRLLMPCPFFVVLVDIMLESLLEMVYSFGECVARGLSLALSSQQMHSHTFGDYIVL